MSLSGLDKELKERTRNHGGSGKDNNYFTTPDHLLRSTNGFVIPKTTGIPIVNTKLSRNHQLQNPLTTDKNNVKIPPNYFSLNQRDSFSRTTSQLD